MGTEQRTTGDPRIMPGIDGKNKLNNPFAQRIAIFFADQLNYSGKDLVGSNLGIENQIIRNAGIQVAELDVRLFRNEEYLEAVRQKVKTLGKKSTEEGLDDMESAKFKRLVGELDEAKGVEGYRKWKKSRNNTVEYMECVSHSIAKQFSPLVSDLLGNTVSSQEISVEEMIALSYIRPSISERLRERALGYLESVNGLGFAIFKKYESYFDTSENGLFWKVLTNEVHATPLTDTN